MRFIVGYNTDKGIKKSQNQDSLLIKTASSPYGRIGLFVICDGMGGLASGELASATIIRGFRDWFDLELPKINFKEVNENIVFKLVESKMLDLNNKILQFGHKTNQRLGTTLVMVLTIDNKAYIFQVGDSRAYTIKNKLQQITVDQSFVQREIERGNLTKEQARNHPKRNILLECIGAREKVNMNMYVLPIIKDDIYLICSDGFYRKLEEDEIEKAINYCNYKSENQITETLTNLTELVKSRYEEDNITAIAVKAI